MHSITQKTVKLLSTFFYIGYAPKVPGTCGSLAGVLIFILLGKMPGLYIFTTIAVLTGFICTGPAEKVFKEKDPGCIVIDEVSGMLLCYCFLPLNWLNVTAGFVLFRFFDIFKPLGIRQVQDIKGAWGIMLDDILAAVYTIAVIFLFNFFRASLH